MKVCGTELPDFSGATSSSTRRFASKSGPLAAQDAHAHALTTRDPSDVGVEKAYALHGNYCAAACSPEAARLARLARRARRVTRL